MTATDTISAQAPAKLILSGEHAVVYGQPALSLALNRYTKSTITRNTPFHISFDLLGLNFKQRMTVTALKRIKYKLHQQYQQFSQGKISIRDVLKHPFELTLYTAMNVLESIKHHLPMGIAVHTQSTIPMGAGLGSSAACVVSLITALCRFLQLDLSVDDYIQLGIESENLQHGISSGLDVNTSYQGGCLFFQNGMYHRQPLPQLPFTLAFTGTPSSTTGECVSACRSRITKKGVLEDFSATTLALKVALAANNTQDIINIVRENHRLLQKIGVVSEKTNAFITEIEQRGGAAKICGAGTLTGDASGTVLIICQSPIEALIKQYGYQPLSAEGDADGATVL